MLNWLHTLSHRWNSNWLHTMSHPRNPGYIVGSIDTYQVKNEKKTYNVTGLVCHKCGRIQVYQGEISEGTPDDRTQKNPNGSERQIEI